MTYRLLVSGGSSDIGRALIKCMHKYMNFSVYATTFTGELDKLLPDEKILTVDFSDLSSFNKLLDKVRSLEITHFVQLHGIADAKDRLDEFDQQQYQNIMLVNLEKTIQLISAILPTMKEKQFGRIVVTSTASAMHGGGRDSFTYGLTKHALLFLTEHLAKHYTQYNILANCVLPGFIDTRFHTRYMKRNTAKLEDRAESIPLKRAGTVEEVAHLIENLIVDNTFISGQAIKIDGGDFI